MTHVFVATDVATLSLGKQYNHSSFDASSAGSIMRESGLGCKPVQDGATHQLSGIVLHEVLGGGNGKQGPGVLKPLPGVVECVG